MGIILKQVSLLKKALLILIRPWLWSYRPLHKSDLSPDPFVQFDIWFKRACRSWWLEFPEAMCLSTIDENDFPDNRMVLLKELDSKGFVFYTNTLSTKGRALARTPKASVNFYWEPLQRQIRIQGHVENLSDQQAEEYFASRLRISQIGAWASKQSQVLESREMLDQRVRKFRNKFRGQPIPRPPHWSGYRLVPHRIEFWKLRPGRLHDRFVYNRSDSGEWQLERLYP